MYLRESLGSAPAIAAIGYIVFSLLMTVGRLTGDWLIVRLGAALIVRAGGLLVIVGIGLALLGPPLIGSAAERLTLRGALAILALTGAIMLALGGVVRTQPDS